VSAKITVVRAAELRGRHGTYDVTVDGSSVGALKRSESLTREVAGGEHDVVVTRDDKHTSPHLAVDVADGEHLTLYASLISERAAYVRSPTRPSDHIVLTTDGSLNNADGTTGAPREARARVTLTVLGLLALVAGFVAPSGPLKHTAFVVFTVATAVGFYLTVRHMRHLYRSPRDG